MRIVAVTLLILIAGLTILLPGGLSAAQMDEATPVDPGQPIQDDGESLDPNNTDDADSTLTSEDVAGVTATFDFGSDPATPGAIIHGVIVTFTMQNDDTANYVGVEVPASWIPSNVTPSPTTYCTVINVETGEFRGFIESNAPGDTCAYVFDLEIPATTVPGTFTLDTNIDVSDDFPSVGSATITVEEPTPQPSVTFGQSPYLGSPGTTIIGATVTFTFPVAGNFNVAARLSTGWEVTNVALVAASASIWCKNPPADSLATGIEAYSDSYCTYAFDIIIPGTAADGDTADIQAFIGDTSVGATPVATGLVEIHVALVSGEFGANPYRVYPGGPATGTLTLTFTGPVGDGQVTISHPEVATATLSNGTSTDADAGVSCGSFVNQPNGDIVFDTSSTNAGACTVQFTIAVPDTTPTEYFSNALSAARSIRNLVTNPSVGLYVRPLPRVWFDPVSTYGVPDTIISSQFIASTIGNESAWTFSLTAPAGWSLGNFQLQASYGSSCGPITDSGTTYSGTQSNIVTFPNSCTYSFDITIPGDAALEEVALTAGLAGSTATIGHLPITVYTPLPPTATFGEAAYHAYPGDTTPAVLAVDFSTPFSGAQATIVNPDPAVLTFTNVCIEYVPSADPPTCDAGWIETDGNVRVTTSTPVSVLLNVTVTIEVAGDASPGAIGNLTASIAGGSPVPPAAFTIDERLSAHALEFSLLAGRSISGTLNDGVSGGMPPYTFAIVTDPAQGQLTLHDDATFDYLANPDATGTDSFAYSVTDSEGGEFTSAAETTGTVTLTFTLAAPTATPTATESAPSPSATATATLEPQTPTATTTPGTGSVLPGRTPTATAIGGDGPGGNGDRETGSGVSQLPSTGTTGSDGGATASMFIVLAMGLIFLLGSAVLGRRVR